MFTTKHQNQLKTEAQNEMEKNVIASKTLFLDSSSDDENLEKNDVINTKRTKRARKTEKSNSEPFEKKMKKITSKK